MAFFRHFRQATLALAVPLGIVTALNDAGAKSRSAEPGPIGSFLAAMDGSKQPPAFPSAAPLAIPFRLGADAFIDYRFIEGGFRLMVPRDLTSRYEEADREFTAECRHAGGTLAPQNVGFNTFNTYLGGDDQGLARVVAFEVSYCVDRIEEPIAALVRIRHIDMYHRQYLAFYVLSAASARLAIAQNQERIARDAQAKRPSDAVGPIENERQQAEWTRWRANLAIGTDTDCGPVIQIRGVMVEVALDRRWWTSGTQPTIWARRDQLFPKDSRGPNDYLFRCLPMGSAAGR